ncbi:MAG: FAD-dependent oxidoreductase [Flavobacteriaceae bacterium]|nr:FAD-dependent oxidoreductase [Flavobacteriaceae bacterium]
MNLSYWEQKSWFSNVDFTIVGAGIVGLHCALYLKKKYPKATILILEKGILPQGASTKNAGFACFGSLSELLNDLKSHSEQELINLVHKRWSGLQLLRYNLGDKTLNYQQYGGYELFSDKGLYDECRTKINTMNKLLRNIFDQDVFSFKEDNFGFKNCLGEVSFNAIEGQIDVGKMMAALLQKVQSKGIKILNNISVQNFTNSVSGVSIKTSVNEFYSQKLFIATNGFANQLLKENIRPARAQVLITSPIENLHIRGTFHLEKGYYYFRNIDNRILLGGGRNLDFRTEETTEFGQTTLVQNRLRELLENTILPGIPFEIDTFWSGIMGMGSHKKAIVKQVGDHVFCGVRLGGMGVAIGSTIGKEMADLLK